MQQFALFCSAILWLVTCGCSQQPTKLARQIAGADHIVATNHGTSAVLSLSGKEFEKFAQAVVSAKRYRKYYGDIFDWEVRFYAGTNFITAVQLQDRVFRIDGTQYSDETGVLQAFYEGPFREASARSLAR